MWMGPSLGAGLQQRKTATVENHAQMRVLIVTNMWPSASAPALGSFVRDQVDALRELDGVEIEVFAFSPGGYARAAPPPSPRRALRPRPRPLRAHRLAGVRRPQDASRRPPARPRPAPPA